MTHFNSFAKNIHSQYGEDGIIEEIVRRLDRNRPAGDRYCVDVGAWDGRFLSNTYRLIAEFGYRAVLIEGDHARFKALCDNFPQESVHKINSRVTWEGEASLDHLLSRTRLPIRFDVLSIDVDGMDYHILDSLRQYRPTLICVEFNPSIPNAVEYVQPRDAGVSRGSSIKALASLASDKGYAVVAATFCNLFLLDRASLGTVGMEREPALDDVRDDAQVRTYVFCGYDGTVLLSQPFTMPWHGLTLGEKDVQVLPAVLRRNAHDYNVVQRAGAFALRRFRRWLGA